MNRALSTIEKIRSLYEELFYPTQMNIRPMTQSESGLYKATNFYNGDAPCIGTFLNASWVAILDYFGVKIQDIEDAQKTYIIPYRAKSSQELATVFCTTLDSLVSLTDEGQLYDNDFLSHHSFIDVNNNNYNLTDTENANGLQRQ